MECNLASFILTYDRLKSRMHCVTGIIYWYQFAPKDGEYIFRCCCILQGSTAASVNLNPQINVTRQSVNQLVSQAYKLVGNLQNLVVGPLKNAVSDLLLAGKKIQNMATSNQTSSKQSINNTLASIQQVTRHPPKICGQHTPITCR